MLTNCASELTKPVLLPGEFAVGGALRSRDDVDGRLGRNCEEGDGEDGDESEGANHCVFFLFFQRVNLN
jgi:hypothetical protein